MGFSSTQNNSGQIDYTNLAGPYYRIFIEGIPLDNYPWIMKQIKSIEINEISSGATQNGQNVASLEPLDMATITIIDAFENLTATTNGLVNQGSISGNPGNMLDLVIDATSKTKNIRVLSQADLQSRQTIYTASAPSNAIAPQLLHVVATESSAYSDGATVVNGLLLTIDTALSANVIGQNIYVGNIINANSLGLFTAGRIANYFPSTNQIVVTGLTGIQYGPNGSPVSLEQDLTIYFVQSQQFVTSTTQTNAASKFLFQEDNIVDIEWGYSTVPGLHRRMRFLLKFVEYDAPDTSSPEVKVYCIPTAIADLKKNFPSIGKSFFELATGQGASNLNIRATPITAGEIVQQIASLIGYEAQVSKPSKKINTNDTIDTDFVSKITPGTSILEYISLLAMKVNYHFELGYDYKTNKDKIIFLSDEDYARLPTFTLKWRGQNSLLTSYNIKVDFSQLPNGNSTAIDPNQPNIGLQTQYQEESALTVALRSPDDTAKGRIATATTTPTQNGLGNVLSSPSVLVPTTVGSSAYSATTKPNDRKVTLDSLIRRGQFPAIITGTMTGYPFMAPCVVDVLNIGLRYSGRYKLSQVKHVIDVNSYKIEFTGVTNVASDTLQKSVLPSGDTKSAEQNNNTQVEQLRYPQAPENPAQTGSNPTGLDADGTANNYTSTPGVPGKVNSLGGIGAIVPSLFQSPFNQGMTQ